VTGIPGLSDIPFVGRIFAHNRKETLESDIVLTLTPHIVRVLDLSETDLRPFRVGRDTGAVPTANLPANTPDRDQEPTGAQTPGTDPDAAPAPAFPQPRQPTGPVTDPIKGGLPGTTGPILPPAPPPPPKKKGGGGS
jgi:general secretion pathway protein D